MIVTDVSVVVKLFAIEEGSDLAREIMSSREEFAAPGLLMLEVGKALKSARH